MTRQEAKIVLTGYRPNGTDASDPRLAEALACARHDPELAAWFSRQQDFDSAVAAKLRAVTAPSTLRDEILVSVRLQPRVVNRRWLLVAAALVLLGFASILVRWRSSSAGGAEGDGFVMFAVNYAANGIVLQNESDDPATSQHWLAARHAPMPQHWPVALAALHRLGCRTLSFKGRTITLICFGGDRAFHLFVARRADFPRMKMPQSARVSSCVDGWSAATWTDADNYFVLVSDAAPGDLQRYLPSSPRSV